MEKSLLSNFLRSHTPVFGHILLHSHYKMWPKSWVLDHIKFDSKNFSTAQYCFEKKTKILFDWDSTCPSVCIKLDLTIFDRFVFHFFFMLSNCIFVIFFTLILSFLKNHTDFMWSTGDQHLHFPGILRKNFFIVNTCTFTAINSFF